MCKVDFRESIFTVAGGKCASNNLKRHISFLKTDAKCVSVCTIRLFKDQLYDGKSATIIISDLLLGGFSPRLTASFLIEAGSVAHMRRLPLETGLPPRPRPEI